MVSFTKALSLVLASILPAIFGLTSPLGPIDKCDSADCVAERSLMAAEFIKYRGENVQPCDNIFKAVCENFNDTEWLTEEMFMDFIGPIKKLKAPEGKIKKHVDDLHEICMDDGARGEKALDLLKKQVEELGGWPALKGKDWKEEAFNWVDFTSEAKKAGYDMNAFLDWEPRRSDWSEENLEYHLTSDAKIDEVIRGGTAEEREAYKKYMKNVAKQFGADEEALKELDEAFEFEIKFKHEALQHSLFSISPMTVEEFQKKFPKVDWQKFVDNSLIPFAGREESPVMVADKLDDLLEILDKTPKRVQANYAIWKMIQLAVPFLTQPIRDLRKAYHQDVKHEAASREENCDKFVRKYAEHAVVFLYLQQFEDSQETIRQMFAALRDEMLKIAKESQILIEEEKKRAEDLLEKMDVTVGRSQKLDNPQELEDFYDDAKVVKDNFLQTVLNMKIFKMTKDYDRKLNEAMAPNQPFLPNNYRDHLYIPAAVVSSQKFDNNRPMFMNFGTLGSLMAREMFSSLVNIAGNITDDQNSRVKPQADCFFHLFDDIKALELKKEYYEMSTRDMIHQFIGFMVARKAYDAYVLDSGPENGLPGVPNTPEQLFWMTFVKLFCYANTFPIPKVTLDGKEMTITEWGITRMIGNQPQVAQDFNCPAGSTLNLKDKCTWW